MNEQEFAQRLRQYRKDKGMTQQELADKLGVSNKTVSRWESGSYPDVATLVALARALGVTVDELLDPKTPVRTLQKSDWQNLLSFAFAIGGGLLFYLLGQFVPLPLCWMLYLGCLAYGIYLQAHYTYHTRWFQLGVWIMVLFVSGSVAGMLLTGAAVLFGISSAETFLTNQIGMLLQGDVDGRLLAVLLMWTMIWLILTAALGLLTAFVAKQLAREPRLRFRTPESCKGAAAPAVFQARFVSLVKGGACPGSPGPDGVLVPVLAGRSAWVALCLPKRTLSSCLGGNQPADSAAAVKKGAAWTADSGGFAGADQPGLFRAPGLPQGLQLDQSEGGGGQDQRIAERQPHLFWTGWSRTDGLCRGAGPALPGLLFSFHKICAQGGETGAVSGWGR